MPHMRWAPPHWHNRSLLNPRPWQSDGWRVSQMVHPASCDERNAAHLWFQSNRGHECLLCPAVV